MQKIFFPNNTACQKWMQFSFTCFQSDHNTERLQLPGQIWSCPCTGPWMGRAMTAQIQLPPLCSGSWVSAAPVAASNGWKSSSWVLLRPTVRGCLPQAGACHPQPAPSRQWLKTLCKGLTLKELTQKALLLSAVFCFGFFLSSLSSKQLTPWHEVQDTQQLLSRQYYLLEAWEAFTEHTDTQSFSSAGYSWNFTPREKQNSLLSALPVHIEEVRQEKWQRQT